MPRHARPAVQRLHRRRVVELLRETGLNLLRKPYDPDQLLFAARRTLDDGGV